jgi:hypothetical protein
MFRCYILTNTCSGVIGHAKYNIIIIVRIHWAPYGCSKCHELFNHEVSQSNYGACLTAASHKAEFLYSAFADVKMLQFNSS